jgi:hypothetical protein
LHSEFESTFLSSELLHASAGNCQICRTVYKETLHAAELLLLLLPPTKGVFLQVAEALLVVFNPMALKVLQKRQITLWENKTKQNKQGQIYK